MRYELYSIKDHLSLEYAPPFAAKNAQVALRKYNNMITQEHLNPDEFSLNLLGSMDTETGLIESIMPVITNGTEKE